MFTHSTHRILIGWLILALLFAQGLRVCMHDYGASHAAAHANDAAHNHAAVATHLESTFSTLDERGEAMADTHVSLIGLLKQLSSEPLVALFFITLLLVLLRQTTVWRVQPRERVFRPPHGHYFSPPLRAPPR